jgi:hypothetical protein
MRITNKQDAARAKRLVNALNLRHQKLRKNDTWLPPTQEVYTLLTEHDQMQIDALLKAIEGYERRIEALRQNAGEAYRATPLSVKVLDHLNTAGQGDTGGYQITNVSSTMMSLCLAATLAATTLQTLQCPQGLPISLARPTQHVPRPTHVWTRL